jgi:hypothetical protein
VLIGAHRRAARVAIVRPRKHGADVVGPVEQPGFLTCLPLGLPACLTLALGLPLRLVPGSYGLGTLLLAALLLLLPTALPLTCGPLTIKEPILDSPDVDGPPTRGLDARRPR